MPRSPYSFARCSSIFRTIFSVSCNASISSPNSTFASSGSCTFCGGHRVSFVRGEPEGGRVLVDWRTCSTICSFCASLLSASWNAAGSFAVPSLLRANGPVSTSSPNIVRFAPSLRAGRPRRRVHAVAAPSPCRAARVQLPSRPRAGAPTPRRLLGVSRRRAALPRRPPAPAESVIAQKPAEAPPP